MGDLYGGLDVLEPVVDDKPKAVSTTYQGRTRVQIMASWQAFLTSMLYEVRKYKLQPVAASVSDDQPCSSWTMQTGCDRRWHDRVGTIMLIRTKRH